MKYRNGNPSLSIYPLLSHKDIIFSPSRQRYNGNFSDPSGIEIIDRHVYPSGSLELREVTSNGYLLMFNFSKN